MPDFEDRSCKRNITVWRLHINGNHEYGIDIVRKLESALEAFPSEISRISSNWDSYSTKIELRKGIDYSSGTGNSELNIILYKRDDHLDKIVQKEENGDFVTIIDPTTAPIQQKRECFQRIKIVFLKKPNSSTLVFWIGFVESVAWFYTDFHALNSWFSETINTEANRALLTETGIENMRIVKSSNTQLLESIRNEGIKGFQVNLTCLSPGAYQDLLVKVGLRRWSDSEQIAVAQNTDSNYRNSRKIKISIEMEEVGNSFLNETKDYLLAKLNSQSIVRRKPRTAAEATSKDYFWSATFKDAKNHWVSIFDLWIEFSIDCWINNSSSRKTVSNTSHASFFWIVFDKFLISFSLKNTEGASDAGKISLLTWIGFESINQNT